MVEDAKKEETVLLAKKEKLRNPLNTQTTIKKQISQLEEDLKKAEERKTVAHAAQKLFNRGALTENEKEAMLASITVQLDAAKQELNRLNKQIEDIGLVGDPEIEKVRQRISSLSFL